MASSSPRASWKGFLRASLVSVPVQAYPATATASGEIRFNQLHETLGPVDLRVVHQGIHLQQPAEGTQQHQPFRAHRS